MNQRKNHEVRLSNLIGIKATPEQVVAARRLAARLAATDNTKRTKEES